MNHERTIADLRSQVARMKREAETLKDKLARATAKARETPQYLLLVVEHDGTASVYGEKRHNVRVVHLPKFPDGEFARAEEEAERDLPKVFRELWLPGNLRATGFAGCCPSASVLLYAEQVLEAKKLVDGLAASLQKEVKSGKVSKSDSVSDKAL